MPLPHNLYDYCSIRISSLVEKYLVVKRKISFVDKADILLTKLIIRGGTKMILKKMKVKNFRLLKKFELELKDDLSLIIGKNNSGKLQLLLF